MITEASIQTQQYKRIVVDGVHYYGKHLILGATGCNDNLLDVAAMTRFIRELVDRIDMVAYGEPVVARFGEGIEEGISGVQLIMTSAITVHTNDMARDLYLDVFSCKDFEADDVLAYVDAFFAPSDVNSQVLLRQ
jgi:S-adenosylmethionine/arginine decarboxylase-like enzyme